MRHNGIFFRRICATTVVILLLFLVTTSTTTVDGFASNLVETKMGCMTDLSIEEVIMNNEVKSPEESDFPKMHLVVLDANENHMETPYHYDPSSLSSSSSGSININIAFLNPYSIKEFRDDLQFVMEVEGPAEFIDGGAIGCEGNIRISGYNNDAVVLKVNDPTAKLRVWGGWATGHSSVRLTPDLILEPGVIISSTTTTNGEEKIKKEEMEKEENPEIISPKKEEEIIREGDNILADEDQKQKLEEQILDEPEKEKHRQKKKNVLDKFLNNVPKGLEDIMDKRGMNGGSGKDFKQEIIQKNKDRAASLSVDNRNIKQKIKDKHAGLTQLNNRKEREKIRHNNKNKNIPKDADGGDADEDGDYGDDEMTIKTANNKKYKNSLPVNSKMKNNFKNEFDVSRHFVACGFFVFSIGLIVMVFGKRRGDKGRRDL
jgi:hypothetical protein